MNLENYSGMRSCLPHLESQILPTPSNTLEYNFSNSKTTLKVIIQPRHANFATCGLYVVWNPGETLEGRAIINWSQELLELPISTVPLVIYSLLVLHLGANTSQTSADLTSLIFSYLNKAFHRWPNWSLISLSSTPALSRLEAHNSAFFRNNKLSDNVWKIREYFHFLLFLRRDWEIGNPDETLHSFLK